MGGQEEDFIHEKALQVFHGLAKEELMGGQRNISWEGKRRISQEGRGVFH